METPSRSFVMTAPPLEPVRTRPNPALRAPNWAYAGAASVAALALAVTVSVDASGGLSSEPIRQEVEVTTRAAAPTPERFTAESDVETATGPETEGAAPTNQPVPG